MKRATLPPLPSDDARTTLTLASAEQAPRTESERACSPLLTSTFQPLCAGIRANGERCRARASTGYDFCSFHRSDLQEAFRAGRIQGGLRRHYEITTLQAEEAARLSLGLHTRGGIQAGLDNLLRFIFTGRVSPKHISAVARIYSTALRNIERTDPAAEHHTFAAYTAALAANHRLQAEVDAAGREQQAAAKQVRETLTAVLRTLIEEPADPEPSPSAVTP